MASAPPLRCCEVGFWTLIVNLRTMTCPAIVGRSVCRTHEEREDRTRPHLGLMRSSERQMCRRRSKAISGRNRWFLGQCILSSFYTKASMCYAATEETHTREYLVQRMKPTPDMPDSPHYLCLLPNHTDCNDTSGTRAQMSVLASRTE